MGASLPPHLVRQRIRRALQRFARENGGTYAKYLAQGVVDGLPWSKGIRVATASNGEQFGFDRIVIGEGEAARGYGFPDLETAVLAYRLDTAGPQTDSALFAGQPGDYAKLIGRRNPWVQTWGFAYALGFNLDSGGFDIFTKEPAQVLTFRGAAADFWARVLWANLAAMGANKDRMKCRRAEQEAHAAAVDNFCAQFIDADGWRPSADWRVKPDYYVGPHNLPRA